MYVNERKKKSKMALIPFVHYFQAEDRCHGGTSDRNVSENQPVLLEPNWPRRHNNDAGFQDGGARDADVPCRLLRQQDAKRRFLGSRRHHCVRIMSLGGSVRSSGNGSNETRNTFRRLWCELLTVASRLS